MDNDTYDDRHSRQQKFNKNIVKRIEELEDLIHYAIGPCTFCNGSGMIYDQDEDAGRDLTRPCEDCKGSGKMPIDFVMMMEKFKVQARKDIQTSNELAF